MISDFARTFVRKNWWRVLWLVLTQAYVVWGAAQGDWQIAVMFSLFVFWHSWRLVEEAAGIPDRRELAKTAKEMTPREAFWLDPAHIFRRREERSGAAD